MKLMTMSQERKPGGNIKNNYDRLINISNLISANTFNIWSITLVLVINKNNVILAL